MDQPSTPIVSESGIKNKISPSRIIIFILMILLPVIGFGLGIAFQASKQESQIKTISPAPSPIPSITELPTSVPTLIPTATPLPTITPSSIPSSGMIKREGESSANFLIQKINQDSVEGLLTRFYPIATGTGSPVTLHIGDSVGYKCDNTEEKIVNIDFHAKTVTFQKIANSMNNGGCPICLSSSTMINTMNGEVNVKDIKAGDLVLSVDKNGNKVSVVVLKTSSVRAPQDHKVVHLVLKDGRNVYVSPGHPTINGKLIGDLKEGEIYNDQKIIKAELVPYTDSRTYDIFPAGDTGFYFANGIPLGSTLK